MKKSAHISGNVLWVDTFKYSWSIVDSVKSWSPPAERSEEEKMGCGKDGFWVSGI